MVIRKKYSKYGFLPLLLVVILSVNACSDQPARADAKTASTTPVANVDTLDAIDSYLRQLTETSAHEEIGQLIQSAGLGFLGSPYVAGMLDADSVESLVIDITSFDCVLLVEAAVAAARAVKSGNPTSHSFAEQIELLRYREGVLNGYCSRLHYFSDWIFDNEKTGILIDITEAAGGIPYEREINFMSNHRSLYKQIATDDSLFAGIIATEKELLSRDRFYIPQEHIRDAYPHVQAGDIIAITTSVAGLDISHTGLAHVDSSGVGFLHASTSGGVIVAPDLSDYVNGNSKQTGIMIARVLPVSR